jgi:hypothetical protein
MTFGNLRRALWAIAIALASSSTHAQSLPPERNRIASAFHFAASERFVAFPVPATVDTVGLMVIDRDSGQKRLIYEDKAFLLYPRFSTDGKRLIIVKNEAYVNERTLMICAVNGWRCRTWLRTAATVRSPVELDESTLLFSSSPVDTAPDGRPRHNKHDFYSLTRDSEPERLSNFSLHEIASINVGGGRLIFTALEAPTRSPILHQVRPPGRPGSEIYALPFDPARRQIESPSRPLPPLVLIDGYSGEVAAAEDGKIAFTNRRGRKGSTHFNLAIADPDGKLERYIEASGWAFSRPVFVGNTVLANETFDRHYEIKLFDLAGTGARTIATLAYDNEKIRALPRLSLRLD